MCKSDQIQVYFLAMSVKRRGLPGLDPDVGLWGRPEDLTVRAVPGEPGRGAATRQSARHGPAALPQPRVAAWRPGECTTRFFVIFLLYVLPVTSCPAWYQYNVQGTHPTGKTGKMAKKNPCQGNTGKMKIFPKHRETIGNFICSSCKFPDAKSKGYCDICRKNFHFFPEAG